MRGDRAERWDRGLSFALGVLLALGAELAVRLVASPPPDGTIEPARRATVDRKKVAAVPQGVPLIGVATEAVGPGSAVEGLGSNSGTGVESSGEAGGRVAPPAPLRTPQQVRDVVSAPVKPPARWAEASPPNRPAPIGAAREDERLRAVDSQVAAESSAPPESPPSPPGRVTGAVGIDRICRLLAGERTEEALALMADAGLGIDVEIRDELRSIAWFNASVAAVRRGDCDEGRRLATLAARFDDPWNTPTNRAWLRTLERIGNCSDFNLTTSADIIRAKRVPARLCARSSG